MGGVIERALVTAGIFVVPTLLLVIWFRINNRRVEWRPLLWAGLSFAIYMLALRSTDVLPLPEFLAQWEQNWVGKSLALLATCAILAFLPSVGFREAGVRWAQNAGSLRPVAVTAVMTIVGATITSGLISSSPDLSREWLTFQATMPGLDEELFMRGLLLLLFHQAFGKGMTIWGAETGWGIWLTSVLFGLLHGVGWVDGALQFNVAVIMLTGSIGFIAGWARERTGSLVIPVLFHNAFNVAQAFV